MGRRSSRSMLLSYIILVTVTHFQIHPTAALQSYFSYCEGDILKNVSQSSCQSGVNFAAGQLRPDCVCVYGIYRMYTDTCDIADGFTIQEICSKITDSSQKTVSMKLATIPPNYNWDTPAFVLEQNQRFGLRVGSSPVLTSETEFFSLNAKPYIMQDAAGTWVICLKSEPQPKKICHYLQSENKDIWTSPKVTLSIRDSCTNEKPLVTNNCFDPLTSDASECSLSCNPNANAPSSSSNDPADDTVKTRTMKKKEFSKADFDKNCTNPDDYRNHDNRFLNRKMLLYNVVNQLDMRNDSNTSILETMEPNNTLSLFSSMKQITQMICPTQYVSSEWIDQVIDLFYILHKGDVFRYEEQLSLEQYTWIMEILTGCQNNITGTTVHVILSSQDNGSNPNDECAGGGSGLATGYCRQPMVGSCNFVPVDVDTTTDNSHRNKHYVPEVAWNIVDLVHVACFAQFNESYRMFHVLEQAVEKLFTLQIKNLWHHPGWLEKTKTKLLGYGADNNMYNFEACIQAAYGMRYGDLPRLVRPFAPQYLRKKRAVVQSVSKVKAPSGRKFAKGRALAAGRVAKGRTSEPIESAIYCIRSPSELVIPSNCNNTAATAGAT